MTERKMIRIAWIAAFAAALGLTASALAEKVTITVGDKDIPAGPMWFKTPKPLDADQVYYLAGKDADIICQLDKEGRVWWWQAKPLKAGQTYTWELAVASTGVMPEPGGLTVRVPRPREGQTQMDVKLSGRLFTSLMYKKDEPKVYLYPVIGPTGEPMTRDHPMKDNPIEKDNGRQDHEHHRSLWCAHGDVRTGDMSKPGANYWSESKNTPIEQRPRQVLKKVIGTGNAVYGLITADIDWVNAKGEKDFAEKRTYMIFAGDDMRIIDIKSVFKFDEKDVMFGDTKEGGIVALRTAVSIDEKGITKPEKASGKRFNSNGKSGDDTWGQPAEWCDYVGPVKGKTVGIAIMDHPKNYGHPTHWHIRDYGLYTANPFGLKDFTKDASKDGSHTWKKGETVEFNYRVLLHKEDTKTANIADQWKLYSDPPKFTVTEK
jgi:hypothetical protein